jgi:hypothetical protein
LLSVSGQFSRNDQTSVLTNVAPVVPDALPIRPTLDFGSREHPEEFPLSLRQLVHELSCFRLIRVVSRAAACVASASLVPV